MSSGEMVVYSHWMVLIQFLKLGIPWEEIQNFTQSEVNLILGIEMAIKEKQQEEQARQMSQQNFSKNTGGF
tara:strand:- start:174 stop:386 length:213 start_codon:yes stop_codon:yes gene_type:complete